MCRRIWCGYFNLSVPWSDTFVRAVYGYYISDSNYSEFPNISIFNLSIAKNLFMQLAGAAYMLYLAWKVWKSSADVEADSGKEASFLSGMLLQFANPKIYIYAITAMTLYILPVYHSTGTVIGFTVLLALIGASGSFAWALFGSAFCKFFSRHTKAVNLVMALLLVYCAVALFL